MSTHPPQGSGPAGFTEPETFTIENVKSAARARLLSPVLLLPLVAGLLLWFMVAAVFGAIGVPAKGILSLLVTVVLMGLLLLAWVKNVEKNLAKTWLRVDSNGMTFHEAAITREIAWSDMTSIARVVPMRGLETSRGGSSAQTGQAIGAGVNRAAQRLSGSVGVLGRGRMTANEGGGLANTLIQQNDGSWGQDADGVNLIGIPPEDVSSNWLGGRIGAWIRHHRPDLVTAYENSGSGPATT